jgi:hypothetical protein
MRTALALLPLLLLAGCKKGYDQVAMGRLTAPEQKIVGKYKMETEFSAGTGEGSMEIKKAMEFIMMLEDGGDTLLECFPDKKFVMTVGELPVTGDWNLADTSLRLRINKIGEQKPEEIARDQLKGKGVSGWSMSPAQRDEFLKAHRGSIALERAESMATMRVSSDGTLYGAAPENSLFGSLISFFKKVKE